MAVDQLPPESVNGNTFYKVKRGNKAIFLRSKHTQKSPYPDILN